MKKNYLLLLLITISSSYAQVSQDFEGITGIGFTGANTCYYFDADQTTVHDLVNYVGPCGEVVVTSPDSSPSTLGFTNSLNPTGVGFSDFDAFGVANASGVASQMPEGPIEGNNSFVMEDTDGEITMRFNLVNLSGTINPEVNLKYRLETTSWETTDILKVYVEITGCAAATTVTLIDIFGTGFDAVEGPIQTLSANLSAYVGCNAQLVIEFASNSSSEEMILDDINFTEGALDSTLSNENFTLNSTLFTIYPNPSNGNITIKNSGIALDKVQITDLNGRVVFGQDLNGITEDKELNLSSKLSSGMYLMTLTSNNIATVKKLIIE
ncbi:T9SS type A sorting domain-containing protein [uncultured Lacinutrix sp.]|uniref:T9SS type A sorting domain-containing protein n=1 Tax=uncultured Lacinutrix sp. TaxID=574032 RepID=UPI00260CEAAE|nr:T9SS type A sorting domain-containing protein [uncultured Lacinutrix sp.]